MRRITLPKRKVLSMFKAGKTLTEIGETFGCTRCTVKNRLTEWGVEVQRTKSEKKSKPPYQDKETLAAAYAETPSTILLGEKYNVGPGAVRAWLHRHSIPVTYKRVVSNADYSKPWTKKHVLAKAYQKKGAKALAKQWGCEATTIFNWLRRFEIPVRSPTKKGVSYEASYTPLRKKRAKSLKGRRTLTGREVKELKKAAGECRRCGYSEHVELLDVHHFDRDRCNNRPSNLAVLCVMCHALDSRGVERIRKL